MTNLKGRERKHYKEVVNVVEFTERELRALGTWTSRGGGTLWADESTAEQDLALTSLLDKLQPYQGTIFRGLHELEPNSFVVGDQYSPTIKVSWSAGKEFAEEYCNNYFDGERYLLVVENQKYGKFVSDLGNLEYSEDEVITSSSSKYTVVSVTPGKEYSTVVLREE